MTLRKPLLSAALACSVALPAAGQTPSDSWRTVRTEHFRIHYPEAAEVWALDIATQVEDIRAQVAAEVGWVPPQTVDMVVRDPFSMANGMAIPLQGRPKMEVWATPPGASSVIGHYDSWTHLLITHEETHLVHLLRPARNPLERLLQGAVGVGPVAWKSPRWVAEGYATVVEGRLTGMGRPNGDYRALFLRELAREGRLPTYAELNGSPRFAGGAYAYLVGSAYLEWLEARAGEGSLRSLWARMSARRMRSFSDAFVGVFGDSPEILYGRFSAELTRDAMALEETTDGDADELWADLDAAVGAPDVSGDRVVSVVRTADTPPALMVWQISDDQEAITRWQEDIAAASEADPDDVAPLQPPTLGRHEISRRTRVSPIPTDPRFLPDGRVLYTGFRRNRRGELRTDLFIWGVDAGETSRVTHNAALRDADPSPDGARAVAIQERYGQASLVTVSLTTGEVTALVPSEAGVLYGSPRFSPDGTRIAVAVHRGHGWTLEVRDLVGGPPAPLAVPPQAVAMFPSWRPDGSAVLATVGRAGLMEAWSFPADGAQGHIVAAPLAGAIAPVDTGDGRLLYGTFSADGLDLHVRDAAASVSKRTPSLSLATRPVPTGAASDYARDTTVQGHAYGLGHLEARPFVGGTTGPGASAIELGLRVGDVLGRNELIAAADLGGPQGADGASLSLTSKALPVTVTATGFAVNERIAHGGVARAGGALTLGVRGALPMGGWRADLVGLADTALPGDTSPARVFGGADLAVWTADRHRGAWALSLSATPLAGVTGGETWARGQGRVSASAGRKIPLLLTSAAGWTNATDPLDQYRLGGMRPSVLPGVFASRRLDAGAFAPGSAAGDRYGHARAAIGAPVGAFIERWWVGPDTTATAIGLTADLDVPGVSLVGVPDGHITAGVACRPETPEAGWLPAPCQSLDHYAAWIGVRWGLSSAGAHSAVDPRPFD